VGGAYVNAEQFGNLAGRDATTLACIAHKSLEICERCRLWQRNSPATPENSAAFWREEFKNSFDSFILKRALKQTRSVCLRAF
jgi:hypothetical protein